MNILVFGKDGQLGRAFEEWLQHSSFHAGNVIRLIGRSDCDLSDSSQITDVLNNFRPELIINAAAYTAVDKAESESDLAFAVNGTAPGLMAQYAAQHGATLLHFSTDYVFDGSKQGAYTEMDQTRPLGIYGKSKESGEQEIVKAFAAVANQIGQRLQVSPMEITPIPASEYPLPAPRPMNSRLSADKLRIELERLGLVSKLPHWNTPWDEQVSTYVNHLFVN